MNALTLAKMQGSDFTLLCENDTIRELATKRLLTLGMPNTKMEHYRYFGIVPLLSKSYRPVKQSVQNIKESTLLEIIDGEIIAAPKDLIIKMEAVDKIDHEHYDPTYYISHLMTPKAIKISISDAKSLQIRHRFSKKSALITYRIVLDIQPNASLFLDEIFEKSHAKDSLVFYGIDITVGKNAQFTWIKDQEIETTDYSMIASHACRHDLQAHAIYKTFDFGSSKALHIYKIDLMEKAHLDTTHLLYADKEAQRGNILQINHKAPYAHTIQNAKHILQHKSRGIFDGLIRVEHPGKYAVTHQNSRSILLDSGAYMISKPQLEIYIDELEASHGSTTGQLNPDQIFYLQSRGISQKEARKMLIFAFAKDVIDTIKDKAISNRLIEKFEKRYSGEVS